VKGCPAFKDGWYESGMKIRGGVNKEAWMTHKEMLVIAELEIEHISLLAEMGNDHEITNDPRGVLETIRRKTLELGKKIRGHLEGLME
jgi:hypothetical protein